MRIACLFSGGKDSTYAVHLAKQAGHEIIFLLAMHPENKESFLFHVPNIEWTQLQAQAMDIPLVLVNTKGEKTQEMKDLKNALSELKERTKIQGIVTGAAASTYQASRIQKICHELDLYCFNPLWQTNPHAHWHEMHVNGFEVILSSVAAQGLDTKWLGRKIDENALPELFALEKKHGLSSIGEGGEFESFVTNAPMFSHKIEITKYKDEWKGLQGTRSILDARFAVKVIASKKKTSKKRRKTK